jgi:hypothetical protein
MNPEFSPGKLRKIAERVKRIRFDTSSYYNLSVAPQEALDFLAMLAGLKPVYVLGRGFDDANWINGIRALSVDHNLFVVDGPPFLPEREPAAMPDWYRDMAEAAGMRHAVSYITRIEAIAEEVMLRSQSGRLSPAVEARLFAYPECCVREYHAKQRRVSETEYRIALRARGGDEDKLREGIGGALEIRPENDEEARALQPRWVMAPFTSFFLCAACEAAPDSPGWTTSARMKRLLQKTGKEMFTVLAKIVNESPVYPRAAERDAPST